MINFNSSLEELHSVSDRLELAEQEQFIAQLLKPSDWQAIQVTDVKSDLKEEEMFLFMVPLGPIILGQSVVKVIAIAY